MMCGALPELVSADEDRTCHFVMVVTRYSGHIFNSIKHSLYSAQCETVNNSDCCIDVIAQSHNLTAATASLQRCTTDWQ
jgi:hypothetical protein